jgi:hypothetical protein
VTKPLPGYTMLGILERRYGRWQGQRECGD